MSDLPIRIAQCEVSRVGLEITDEIQLKDWLSIGEKLFAVGSCYQFLIGDWLNYGERKYGEKYAVACDELGIDYQTGRHWASTCARIELCRRQHNLTFSHHYEVAKLSDKEQDKWLKLAGENKWSVADLREKIRDNSAEYANEDHGKPVKTFTGYIANAVRIINQRRETISTWSSDERERTAELLRPIVDFYEELKATEVQ